MGATIHEQFFKVDLNRPLARRDVGSVATYDSKANRYGAELYRDGAAVDASGLTVYGYFIRPDEETVVMEGEADGNRVFVDLDATCYAYDGAFSLVIKVSENGCANAVLVCDGNIIQSRTDAVVDPGSVIPSLDDLLAQIAAVEEARDEALAAAEAANEAAASVPPISDESVGVNLWTSLHTVEQLAPAITAVGNPVDFYPVHGYPLDVVLNVEPQQQGEGVPSMDNIRPIIAPSEIRIRQHSYGGLGEHIYNIPIGSPFAGGTVSATVGQIVHEYAILIFDGTEEWKKYTYTGSASRDYMYLRIGNTNTNFADGAVCSHASAADISASNTNQGFCIVASTAGNEDRLLFRNSIATEGTTALESWKAYLAQQYAAGTPVTVAYKPYSHEVEEPEPLDIKGLSGQNWLYADILTENGTRQNIGTLTVISRVNPYLTIKTLESRVAELEAAIAEM